MIPCLKVQFLPRSVQQHYRTMTRIALEAVFAALSNFMIANANITGVSIPIELTYLLPQSYQGNSNASFLNTQTKNDTINGILGVARNATFYAFDQEFFSIVNTSSSVRTIALDSPNIAHEGGVWVHDRNEVWFTSRDPNYLYSILDLNTHTVRTIQNSTLSSQGAPNLGGSSYLAGSVYFSSQGNKSASLFPAIYSVDPATGVATTILDSYYGIPLNNLDDLSWTMPNASAGTACSNTGPVLFLTSLDLSANGEEQYNKAVLPNGIWRFAPSTKSLQAVISRADILAPNGIAVDPHGQYLYVSDAALTALTGPGSDSSGSQAIYKFDLDADCYPVNKRLFGIVRDGIADGMHVDGSGRLWTAEFDGIHVRHSTGRELGVFNGNILVDEASAPISNFALAGDKLVLLAGDAVRVVQLSEYVTKQG